MLLVTGRSSPVLRELKALAAKLPPVPSELTAKNKAFLAELESDSVKARVLFLPQTGFDPVTFRL
jgi:hypothetical protein